MEPLYEDRCIYTRDTFKEGERAAVKPLFKKVTGIFVVLSIAAALLSLMMTRMSYTTLFFALILVSAILIRFVFPRKMIESSIKRIPFNERGELIDIIRFFDQYISIENESTGSSFTYKYNQFSRFVETKNLIVLMMNRQYVIVKKDGFDKGNLESFLMFLRQQAKTYQIKTEFTDNGIDGQDIDQDKEQLKRVLCPLLIVIAVILIGVEIIYRVKVIPKGGIWIYNWLEMFFIGIIDASFITVFVLLSKLDKKKCLIIIMLSFIIFLSPSVIKSLTGKMTIVKLSPDKKHVLALDHDTKTGSVVVNNTYYYLIKREREQLPYTVIGNMKYQWLQNDVCTITYKSTDSNAHQYIQTFGARDEGISYLNPVTAVIGNWTIKDTNHAGWEMHLNKAPFVLKNGSDIWKYDYADCIPFGTSAIALCKNGVPEWSLVLNEDCKIGKNDQIAGGGTLTLCKVSMEKTQPYTFVYTGDECDYTEQSSEESNERLNGISNDFFNINSTDKDIYWDVRNAVRIYEEKLRVNGVDNKTQINSIQRTAGDENEGVYEVKMSQFFVTPGNQGSQPTGEKTDFKYSVYIMKTESNCCVRVSTGDIEETSHLKQDEGEIKDFSNDSSYHYFLQGNYDVAYMYVNRKSPKEALDEIYNTQLKAQYQDPIVGKFEAMPCLFLTEDRKEILLYDGISEDLKNYCFIRGELQDPDLGEYSRMEVKESYTIPIENN